jgi:hypothetical protein
MRALKAGYALPKVVMDGLVDTRTPHVVDDPTKSLLRPVHAFSDAIASADRV